MPAIHAEHLSATVQRIQSMQDAANEAIRRSPPAPPVAAGGGGEVTVTIPAPWDADLTPAETPVEELTSSPIEATPAAVVGMDLDALVTDATLPGEDTPTDRARAVVTGDREAGTRPRRLWRMAPTPEPSSRLADNGEGSL